MKKLIAIVLSALMLISVLPMTVFAAVEEVLNASGISLEGAVFEQETDRNDQYPWVIDNTTLGKPAIKSTIEGKNKQTSLICFHVAGQGYLEIDYTASTEEGWDMLYFQADGKTVGVISGEEEGTIKIRLVGEGQSGLDYHRIFAYYRKDEADADGRDAAWITGMRFTPAAELPADATINGIPYYSLSSAIDAANESEEDCTVVMQADVTASFYIYNDYDKTVTLDLNGHVLTSVASNNIDVYTPFVLTDSKIDEGTGKYLSLHENAMYNSDNGKITIRDVVIENTNTSGVTPTIVYAPKAAYPVYIEGAKTKITIAKSNGNYAYTTNGIALYIREGAFFSKDPTPFVKEFGLEVVETEGGWSVINDISDAKWLYYHSDDENDISVSEDGKTYTVKTAEGLAQILYLVNSGASNFAGKTVLLANDIDLGAHEWVPIGRADSTVFKGTFDGQGHTISNLHIKKHASSIGFFGTLQGTNSSKCVVKNVTFNNVDVVATDEVDCGAGAVAGASSTNVEIRDVNVTGKINIVTGRYAGGIVGNYCYASFYNCTVDGQNDESFESVIGCFVDELEFFGSQTNYSGGIVGLLGEGKLVIDNCLVQNITIRAAGMGAGGIAGVMQSGGVSITNNTVKDVHFDCSHAEALGWTGSVVGKDYTKAGSAPAVLINNKVSYTADVAGVQNEYIFYVGNDHGHTSGDGGEYIPNTIIADNAVFDESGKIIKGDFIFIGEKAKETALTLISPSVQFSDLPEGSMYDSSLSHTCTPADDYVVTKDATCTAEGEKILKCTVCGDIIETKTIDMLPHTDNEPFDGHCDVCGKNICTHAYGEYILSKPATAEEDAEETATCTICGAADTRTIPGTSLEVSKAEAIEALKALVAGDNATDKMIAIANEGIAAINAATSKDEVKLLLKDYTAKINAERETGSRCDHPVTGLCYKYKNYENVPFLGKLLEILHRVVHFFHFETWR